MQGRHILSRCAPADLTGQSEGPCDTDDMDKLREGHMEADMECLGMKDAGLMRDDCEQLLSNGIVHFSVRRDRLAVQQIGGE